MEFLHLKLNLRLFEQNWSFFIDKNAVFLVSAGLIAFVVWWNWLSPNSSGFTNEDVSAIKIAIHNEYKKRDGIIVESVEMIKKESNSLIGFVKIKNDLLGSVTVPCNATKDVKGGSYIWHCGNGV